MDSQAITTEVVAAHNLTQEEYARIVKLLGREPTFVELGVFSVMWSEHCSYKSSRVHLKRLPTTGERVVVPPGENADRKSTRLNSSHANISYAVFCLKKKKK